jgi:formylglycine-generating enzyme
VRRGARPIFGFVVEPTSTTTVSSAVRSTQYLFLLFVGCRTASAETVLPSGTHEVADASAPTTAPTLLTAEVVSPPATNALATVEPQKPSACPAGMVLVEGEFCPDVEQQCLEWMDPPGRYQFFRCKHYAHLEDKACKSKKKLHERFCIDEKERTEPGGDLPLNHQSWTTSKKLCEANGARLCLTREWVFACEGEEMRPYPYGWDRDSTICNADIDHGLGHIGRLVDHRAPASAHPTCKSAFGLYDMAGNVDEWTTIENLPRGSREVMHGSWWMPGRNVCRAYQGGHGAFYEGTESGTRCCADAKE